MTLYDTLARHLDARKYIKGANKGAAPADTSRRGKTHFRVERRDADTMVVVVFHNTDIITAHSSGSVTLRADGYDNSPTTRAAFWHFGFNVRTQRVGATPNTVVSWHIHRGQGILGPTYVFFEGMTLTPDGKLDQSQTPCLARKEVADRDARKAFREDPDVKAFREVLPILAASQEHMDWRERLTLASSARMRRLDEVLFARHENWPSIVARIPSDKLASTADAWAWLHHEATKDMTNILEVPL